jgi:hypothetical protein
MTLVIRKHIFITSFIRLNIFNSGFSVSVGHRNLGWVTFDRKGITESVPIASGVYVTDSQRWADLRPPKR